MTDTPAHNLRLSVMQLLTSQDAAVLSIAHGVTEAGQWPQVILLCRQWKMLSSLEARVTGLGIEVPASDRTELSRHATHAFVQSNLSIRAGSVAMTALEGAKIRCAGFKGIAAIAYLYSGARSRILQDVDILIEPHNVEAAFRVLESCGYRRSFPGSLADYLGFVRNAPGAVGNEAMSLTDAVGGTIDLHWHLGSIDTRALLDGVRYTSVLNQTLPLLDAKHCLLLCVHHALRNDFVPDDIARDILDFDKWLTHIDNHDSWQHMSPDIERWGLKPSCLALDLIATHLRGRTSAKLAVAATPSELQSARRIAALYFHQLQAGPLNTDLTYLASTKPWLQIVSGLATDWRQYRSHMRQSEALNGEPSLTVASRAWRFLRSAIYVSPKRWLQLRALARAKDGVAAAKEH